MLHQHVIYLGDETYFSNYALEVFRGCFNFISSIFWGFYILINGHNPLEKFSLKLYLNKYWSCRCKLSKNLLKVLYSYENVLFPFGSCSISCERKIFCYFDLDHTLYEPARQLSYNVTQFILLILGGYLDWILLVGVCFLEFC